jgi:N12 class adenine-specific DNA methylase
MQAEGEKLMQQLQEANAKGESDADKAERKSLRAAVRAHFDAMDAIRRQLGRDHDDSNSVTEAAIKDGRLPQRQVPADWKEKTDQYTATLRKYLDHPETVTREELTATIQGAISIRVNLGPIDAHTPDIDYWENNFRPLLNEHHKQLAAKSAPVNVTPETPVWEMAPNQFLAHRRDQALETHGKTYLQTPLEKWDMKALQALTVPQVQEILRYNGLPYTGTKQKLTSRIMDNGRFRDRMAGKTPEQLADENNAKSLDALVRFVGAPMLGNKLQKAKSVLGNIESQRKTGEMSLATHNFEAAIIRAKIAGEPVPDKVFQRWGIEKPNAAAVKPAPLPAGVHVAYFTGSGLSEKAVTERAGQRGDLGLVITPQHPDYVLKAKAFPVVAIDNAVFSKDGFDEKKFRALLSRVVLAPGLKEKVRFVVAPDVLIKNEDGSVRGDAAGTLAQFPQWSRAIRAMGLPVAFAAQDGLEGMLDQIPWDQMDVLFIAGSTDWKLGKFADKDQYRNWRRGIIAEARRRGIPVHVGRVNSAQRLNLSVYGHGAVTVDGNYIGHGPAQNLPAVEKWLDLWNQKAQKGYESDTAVDGGLEESIEWLEAGIHGALLVPHAGMDSLKAYLEEAESTLKSVKGMGGQHELEIRLEQLIQSAKAVMATYRTEDAEQKPAAKPDAYEEFKRVAAAEKWDFSGPPTPDVMSRRFGVSPATANKYYTRWVQEIRAAEETPAQASPEEQLHEGQHVLYTGGHLGARAEDDNGIPAVISSVKESPLPSGGTIRHIKIRFYDGSEQSASAVDLDAATPAEIRAAYVKMLPSLADQTRRAEDEMGAIRPDGTNARLKEYTRAKEAAMRLRKHRAEIERILLDLKHQQQAEQTTEADDEIFATVIDGIFEKLPRWRTLFANPHNANNLHIIQDEIDREVKAAGELLSSDKLHASPEMRKSLADLVKEAKAIKAPQKDSDQARTVDELKTGSYYNGEPFKFDGMPGQWQIGLLKGTDGLLYAHLLRDTKGGTGDAVHFATRKPNAQWVLEKGSGDAPFTVEMGRRAEREYGNALSKLKIIAPPYVSEDEGQRDETAADVARGYVHRILDEIGALSRAFTGTPENAHIHVERLEKMLGPAREILEKLKTIPPEERAAFSSAIAAAEHAVEGFPGRQKPTAEQKSYRVWAFAENEWVPNGQYFASKEEADAAGSSLMSRWMAAKKVESRPEDHEPTHFWDKDSYSVKPLAEQPAAPSTSAEASGLAQQGGISAEDIIAKATAALAQKLGTQAPAPAPAPPQTPPPAAAEPAKPGPAEPAKAGPIPPGRWMNRMEIEEVEERYNNPTMRPSILRPLVGKDAAPAVNPVLATATKFLRLFQEEVDNHSDGWSSWKLPSHAAGQLMGIIQHPEYATAANLTKALAQIKAFYTRHGNKAGMKWPSVAGTPTAAPAPKQTPAPPAPAPAPEPKHPLSAAGQASRDAMRARIQAKKDKPSFSRNIAEQQASPVDPQDLVDLATIGGEHIVVNGATDYSVWRHKMLADVPDLIEFVGEQTRLSPDAVLRYVHEFARGVAKNFGVEVHAAPPEDKKEKDAVTGARSEEGSGKPAPGPADAEPLEGSAPQDGAANGGDEGSVPVRPGGDATVRGTDGDLSPGGAPVRQGGGEGAPGGVHRPGKRGGQPKPAVQTANAPHGPEGDFRLTPEEAAAIEVGGAKAKARNNLEAIRTIKKILEEGSRPASLEEQQKIARYVGWGDSELANGIFGGKPEWGGIREDLQNLLTKDEYKAAEDSTINAHYTRLDLTAAMWDAARSMGFRAGGSVAELGMGIGNFFISMPEDLLPATSRTGVEMDLITGSMARSLYPGSNVVIKPLQQTNLPDGYYDLIIGNFPFGKVPIYDPHFKRYPFLTQNIHNYFFAKGMEKLRPGGVMLVVTSRFTMDGVTGAPFRKWLGARAEFLGAIRLPRDTFKRNAGTLVTTDILAFRRRIEDNPLPASTETWEKSSTVDTKDGYKVEINEYFQRHPEMMMGEMRGGTQYHRGFPELHGEFSIDKLRDLLGKLPQDVLSSWDAVRRTEDDNLVDNYPDADHIKEGAYAIVNGALVRREGAYFRPVPLEKKREARVRGLIELRGTAREVIRTQRLEFPDTAILAARQDLNKAYDGFVKEHGPINSYSNILVFADDPDWPLVAALEEWDKGAMSAIPSKIRDKATGKKGAASFWAALSSGDVVLVNGKEHYKVARKARIFSERVHQKPKAVEHTDLASDALAVSLNELGRLDWDRMQQLTGREPEEMQRELAGKIFRNPVSRQWELQDEYLSGNVRKKLAEAEFAALEHPEYETNAAALRAVQPPDKGPDKIKALPGANWIPDHVYSGFIREVLKVDADEGAQLVRFIPQTGTYAFYIPHVFTDKGVVVNTELGNAYFNGLEMLEQLMNGRSPICKDTWEDEDGKEHTSKNPDATIEAVEKQKTIADRFAQWLWSDPKRAEMLTRKFNDERNNLRLREYDGSHLTFPGLNTTWLRNGTPDPHQKNAVWRTLQSGNTLYAHVVGAGKTLEAIMAAMELKRLGLGRKPMMIVPNHLVGQWQRDWMRAYPGAQLLVPTKKDFKKESRNKLMARIATGNYDGVIVGHNSFEKLPVKAETYKAFVDKEIEEIETALEAARSGKSDDQQRKDPTVKQLIRRKKSLEARLEKRLKKEDKDNSLAFEDLGVDWMFVDEADLFKNLGYMTQMDRIAGLPNSDSDRATDMLLKTRYITNLHGGSRGLVFMTGTPVSNSIAEVWTMMRYLMPKYLEQESMDQFDSWAKTFGEKVTQMEVAPEGGRFVPRTRFSKFVNATALMNMFRLIADIKTASQLNLPTPAVDTGGPQDIVAPASDVLKAIVQWVGARADDIRSGKVKPDEDCMLEVCSYARKASLDVRLAMNPKFIDWLMELAEDDPEKLQQVKRLVEQLRQDDPNSKGNQAVRKILEVYKQFAEHKATQLVFLDLSTPKAEKVSKKKKDTDAVAPPPREIANPANEEAEAEDIYGEKEEEEEEEVETADESRQRFTVYQDIKNKLVQGGIKPEEIAFIHDANTDTQKLKLFEDMNAGRVRVLLGSTEKLGAGTNVQQRLIALHHLDAPWRPRDMEQREGRIKRQGNTLWNEHQIPVRIYRYQTEGSFDAFMWETIASKAKPIEQLMEGDPNQEEVDELSPVVMSYEQAKAVSSGNPLIREKIMVDQEVQKLEILRSAWLAEQSTIAQQFAGMPAQIAAKTQTIDALESDIATRDGNKDLVLKGQTYSAEALRKEGAAALVKTLRDLGPISMPTSIDATYRGFDLLAAPDHNVHPYLLIGTKKGETVTEHAFYREQTPDGKYLYFQIDLTGRNRYWDNSPHMRADLRTEPLSLDIAEAVHALWNGHLDSSEHEAAVAKIARQHITVRNTDISRRNLSLFTLPNGGLIAKSARFLVSVNYDNPAGAIASAEGKLRGLEETLNHERAELGRLNKQKVELESRIGRGFAKEEDLRKASRRAQELSEQLGELQNDVSALRSADEEDEKNTLVQILKDPNAAVNPKWLPTRKYFINSMGHKAGATGHMVTRELAVRDVSYGRSKGTDWTIDHVPTGMNFGGRFHSGPYAVGFALQVSRAMDLKWSEAPADFTQKIKELRDSFVGPTETPTETRDRIKKLRAEEDAAKAAADDAKPKTPAQAEKDAAERLKREIAAARTERQNATHGSISDYVKKPARISPPKNGWFVGELDGRGFYSDGAILVEGKTPTAKTEPSVSLKAFWDKAHQGDAKPIRPAAFATAPEGMKASRLIWFTNGVAIDSAHYDWFMRLFPKAQFAEAPTPRRDVIVRENGRDVGVIVAQTTAVAPPDVQELIDQANGVDVDADKPAYQRIIFGLGRKKSPSLTADKLRRLNEYRDLEAEAVTAEKVGGKGIFVHNGKVLDIGNDLHADRAAKMRPGTVVGDAVQTMLKGGAVRGRGERIELYDRALTGNNLLPAVENAVEEARRKRLDHIVAEIHGGDGRTEITVPLSDIGDFLNKPRIYVRKRQYGTPESVALNTFWDKPAYERATPAKGFYSQLERTIEEKMPGRVLPQQALAILRNPQNGVKGEELDWNGIADWIQEQKGSISKEQLLAKARENRVYLQEIDKADVPEEKTWTSIGGSPVHFKQHTLAGGENYHEFLLTVPRRTSPRVTWHGPFHKKSYDAYHRRPVEWTEWEADDGAYIRTDPTRGYVINGVLVQNGAQPTLEEAQKFYQEHKDRAETQYRNRAEEVGNFHTSHWPNVSNVIAHLRFNDRTGPNGEKILHLEEIQSDWHQAGRKRGYRNGSNVLPPAQFIEQYLRLEKFEGAPGDQPTYVYTVNHAGELAFGLDEGEPMAEAASNEDDAFRNALDEVRRRSERLQGEGVPAGPFAKSWHELAFKRALEYAVEHGYNQMTWTTGAQQSARYDLSKHLDTLQWDHNPDGSYDVIGRKDGQKVIGKEKISADEMEQFVGKDIAEKIVDGVGKSDENPHMGRLTGLDLRVGGEGMQGFYDRILPTFAKKYTKKWGAKVGMTEIATKPPASDLVIEESDGGAAGELWAVLDSTDPGAPPLGEFESREAAEDWIKQTVDELEPTLEQVHSIDITPEMRASVEKGQPMFQRGGAGESGPITAKFRNGTLYTNAAGVDAIAGLWGDKGIRGMVLEQRHAAFAVKGLRRLGASTGAQKGLRELAAAIETAAKADDGRVVVAATSDSLSAMKGTLRHERFHGKQAALPGHLGDQEAAFLSHPLAVKAAAPLKESGYTDHQLALEIGAHLAGGQWAELGLDREEAKQLWFEYLSALEREHGPRALQVADNVAPMLRGALREAERRRGNETAPGQPTEGPGGAEDGEGPSSDRPDAPRAPGQDRPAEARGRLAPPPSTTLGGGLGKFVQTDLLPGAASISRGATGSLDDIRILLAPQTRGPKGRQGGGLVRELGGEMAQRRDRALAALEGYKKYFEGSRSPIAST